MKESIRHFPPDMQEALKRLSLIIRRKIKDTAMIIVVDRNDLEQHVRIRREVSDTATDMRDLEIVVVSNLNLMERRRSIFSRIDNRFLQVAGDVGISTSPVYFNISVMRLNEGLASGNLFCVNIRRYGIMLYDSKEFALVSPQQVDYAQVCRSSHATLEQHLLRADEFLWGAEQYHNRSNHTLAVFLLSLAAENLMDTLLNIYLQYHFQHTHLEEWLSYCKLYTTGIRELFPCDSDEEKRLFALLNDAQKETRFRLDFTIQPEDAETLMLRVLELRTFTERSCEERIGHYAALTSV